MASNQLLTKEHALFPIDSFLYRSSLLVVHQPKHSWQKIFSPLSSFAVALIFCLQRVVVLLYGNHTIILQICGDVTEVINLRFHFNTCFILLAVNSMYLQVVFYRNHKKGIAPTFLKVFDVLTASKPANTIGLTDENDIRRLIAVSKRLFKFLNFNVKNNPLLVTTFVLCGYWLRAGLTETLALGIPYSVLTSLWSLAWWNVVGFQFVAFYVICRYLRCRIRAIDTKLIEMSKNNNFINMPKTLAKCNKLFHLIDEYDRSYFSKFIFSFWMFFGSVIVFSFFQVVFSQAHIVMRLIMAYIGAMFAIIFFRILFLASAINQEAFDLNKSVRRLAVSLSKFNHEHRLGSKLKYQIKLNALIARISDDKVGFSCWSLFVIDNFRCYEVICSMAMLLLKTLEIGQSSSS